MATAVETNTELVRAVNDGLNEQNPEVFREHHASDIVLHDGGEEVRGIEDALAHEMAIWTAFPDLEHTLEAVVAAGDEVAYRFTARGTHDGLFRGIEPTGKSVEITGQGFVHVTDGQIDEVWLEYDRLGMLQQLGVVEPPQP